MDGFADGMRRFLQEAQALIALQNCPNVVSCRDFFRANGTAYLVMEYEDGKPLSELLDANEKAGTPFAEEELLAVVTPLLAGLTRVHEAGMLHRDIKPSNILIRRVDEQPVLIDFGASKQIVANHTKSSAPFTPGYAAPEQVGDGEELGPWTDIYAVGALMWRMVAGGSRPWEPPNPTKAETRSFRMLSKGDPLPPATELGAGRFSPGLLAVIDRCLNLQVEERVQDCEELLGLIRGDSPPDPVPTFTVETDPLTAQVQFSDGTGKYRPGMRLRPGMYRVQVGAVGYETTTMTIQHGNQATIRRVELELAPSMPDGSPQATEEQPHESREEFEWSFAGDLEPRIRLFSNRGIKIGMVGVIAALVLWFALSPSDPHRFSIETEPVDATVVFSAPRLLYADEMPLALGRYEVKVSAPGYETRLEWVEHEESGLPHRIELNLLEKPPLDTKSEQDLRGYLARMRSILGSEDYVSQAEARITELANLNEKAEISRRNARIAKQRKQEEIRIQVQGAWNKIKNATNIPALKDFIEKWKNEPLALNYLEEARSLSANLEAELTRRADENRKRIEAQEREEKIRTDAEDDWDYIKNTTNISRLEDFIDKWGDETEAGTWVRYAQSRRDELRKIERDSEQAKAAWNQIRNTSSISRVNAFINEWEDKSVASEWVKSARRLRDRLEEEESEKQLARERERKRRTSPCIVAQVDAFGNQTGRNMRCPGSKVNLPNGNCRCETTFTRFDGLTIPVTVIGVWE